MATVPSAGTTFELTTTATLSISTVSSTPAVLITGLALAATASLSISRITQFPAIGALEIGCTTSLSIGKVNVVHPGAALIGDALEDILHMFGCCGTTNDCVLEDAVRSVNTGLQQFYLSDRSKGVATNVQRQVYQMSGPLDSDIDGAGARLPDLNVSQDAMGYGVSNLYSVLFVQKVTYTYTGGTLILRPASVSPGSMSRPSIASPNPSEGSLVSWHEDSADADNIPLFYEVFQHLGVPIIRVSPQSDQGGSEYVTVHYIPRPEPVTAADLTNGAAFDVQAAFVESWIMPLCRYAALSTGSFDHQNQSLAAAVKERYQAVLGELGLADIQQPNT